MPARRKRLILHIGMHKTGTSSVQRYFSRNRLALRRLGVCYPRSIGPDGRGQPKHNAIFLAISHEADFGRPHPVLGPSAPLIAAAADEIARAPGRVGVLSAEGFSGERPVFAAALAPLAERFDVTVIAFLRRQDLWVESFYKQMVLNRDTRERRDFAAFLAAPETQAHMDYAGILGWWVERFGAGRVAAHPFHPTGPDRPLAVILRAIGGPGALGWLPFARAHENRSPSAAAVEVVRHANIAGVEVARADIARIEARVGPAPAGYLSPAARRALLAAHETPNLSLSAFPGAPRNAPFFPPLVEDDVIRERGAELKISARFSAELLGDLGLTT